MVWGGHAVCGMDMRCGVDTRCGVGWTRGVWGGHAVWGGVIPLHCMQSNCVFPIKHIRSLDLLD